MTDRTWIWLGIGALALTGLGLGVNMLAEEASQPWLLGCGWLVFAIAGVLGFAALRELWMDGAAFRLDMWTRRQNAVNTTPVVRLAEALRGLHPEAVRVLNRFGVRTQWQVKIDVDNGGRDWILFGTNVHFGFVEFVLNHSTDRRLYPKNLFSEGSKQWDPDGMVNDRDQYGELEAWMQSRLMVTRTFGNNHPAEFLPPWTPELVMEVMGMVGEQELYRPALNSSPSSMGRDEETLHGEKLADLIPLDKSVSRRQ